MLLDLAFTQLSQELTIFIEKKSNLTFRLKQWWSTYVINYLIDISNEHYNAKRLHNE
jgi:hypothetical protein